MSAQPKPFTMDATNSFTIMWSKCMNLSGYQFRTPNRLLKPILPQALADYAKTHKEELQSIRKIEDEILDAMDSLERDAQN